MMLSLPLTLATMTIWGKHIPVFGPFCQLSAALVRTNWKRFCGRGSCGEENVRGTKTVTTCCRTCLATLASWLDESRARRILQERQSNHCCNTLGRRITRISMSVAESRLCFWCSSIKQDSPSPQAIIDEISEALDLLYGNGSRKWVSYSLTSDNWSRENVL